MYNASYEHLAEWKMGNEDPSPLNTDNSFFINGSGFKIYCRYWKPVRPPRALVFVAHGLMEHSLDYDPVAKLLVSKDCYVFSHDHMGFGKSEGTRNSVDMFEHYIRDIFHHVELMKQMYPSLPVFAIAHCMGGTMCILANIRRPYYFKGMVLISPLIVFTETDDILKLAVIRLLRIACPWLPVTYTDYNLISRSDERVEEMKKDSLITGDFNAGFLYNVTQAVEEVESKVIFTDFPFLILQGKDDKICHRRGAEEMYKLSLSKDKSLKIYPSAYHSLLFEPFGVKEEVMKGILQWLEARL